MSSSEKSSGGAPPQSQSDVRSSSPAVKRRVSEIAGNEQQSQDVEMETGSSEQQSTETDPRPAQRRATSVDMIGSEENAEKIAKNGGDSSSSDTVYPTPSSMSAYTASTSTRESSKTHEAAGESRDLPSVDEQVAMVMELMAKPLEDRQKGYIVSANWLHRVLARSSQAPRGAIDKSAMEGDIGPVDNSDLVLVTDPSTTFKDEAGEPFVPLRPGLQLGEDFEIVSQEAWDLIMKWYGLAEQSPAIVRYAHNTNTAGGERNIQYEINPPIFTILKLSNPANGVTTQSLKDKSTPPVKTLASRHTNFQKWLRQAKELAHIPMTTKVRVWKILGGLSSTQTSGVITPAVSRSSSPAPGATLVPSAGSSLLLDVNTFVSLAEGSQRELLEDARDQTANEKYNGSMTLDLAGLTANDVVVLEEQIGGPGGGEWVSEVSKQTLNRLGVAAGNNKNGAVKQKSKTPSVSGRSSPIPEPARGRRKDGKPKGNTGFGNLGNTCYMNAALQCVRSVEELTLYFLNDVYKKDLNPNNPLAHNGDVARAYANLLHIIYDEGPHSFSPKQFKHTVGRYGPAFSGYGQQDSQEFLLFLLDGLQEDLNRIQKKPYIEKPDSTDEMVHNHAALKEFADKCWDIYKARNDSVITDLFAGMYKSTLVCPVCNKVSIIFDPFNNLTLQLPVENLWSKEVFYFPLHKPPVLLDLEIDKNSSIKALKEHVGKKMGADPQRLIMAEIYKSKFYKLFDNTATIADSNIGSGDDIGIFEVEMVPTNYNPDRPKKSFSMLSFSHMDTEDIPSIDSPRAERLLVPIFNRVSRPGNRYGSRQVFGAPLFAVFTREEARDYDTILRKVLQTVATLTTRDILNEADDVDSAQEDSPDSDTVVMNEEDADSADSKIKTASVEGEDGLVDVSMRDASDASKESTAKSIPRRLRNLFQMKVVKSRSEIIPLGFSCLEENKDYPLLSSRLKRKPAGKPVARKPAARRVPETANSPVSSSDDELNEPPEVVNKRIPRTSDESDESDTADIRAESDSESGGDIYPGNRMFSESKKKQSRNGAVEPEPQDAPLIRPGEGIVLDWSEQNHDALFGADPKDKNSLRGAPTWTNVEHFPDPELAKKRQMRQNRRKKGLTLDQCLDEFGREEILSENDAWYCPRCKEHRRASKTFELWKTPDILVIHLKRFSAHRGFRDKIDDLVDFPVEGLDLTGRVRAPEEGESLIYDLFAVDNHYGGLGGGHYTAYAKNFLTGEWNEYNDAHVSKAIDPQKVVSPAAYLLFYRRRSDRPLGGKLLQDIAESSVRGANDSDSQTDSRAESPAGEGRRLGDSSRNGSSSALTGVGAAHQAGDGGLRTVTRVRNVAGDDDEDDDDDDDDDDEMPPPKYSNGLQSGEKSLGRTHRLEGMDSEDLDPSSGGMQSNNPLSYVNEPAWSFDRATDAHGPSQMAAAAPPGSYYDEDDEGGLFDDDEDADVDSNKAVGGDDVSDSELPLADETGDYPPMILDDVPPVSDDEDEELPVVELRVNEEDRIVSD
ncbi:hypothetical protein VTN77DRAFT_6296 [Rasamsonia byssochlamydoides]|uniref:uncharacterized protein n=1 Tax=Rasamsonia byssochlamydoides TaxID=89139 RepID=UPI00374228E9